MSLDEEHQDLGEVVNGAAVHVGEEEEVLEELRHHWGQGDFEAIARIVLTLGDSQHSGQIRREVARIVVGGSVYQFAHLLQALHKSGVAPHHAVALFRMVEKWFREQRPNLLHWNIVVSALVRAEEPKEAMALVEEMEADPDLPSPGSRTYTSLIVPFAKQEGPEAATSLLARMGYRSVEPDSVTYMMVAVVHARASPPNVDATKVWVRKAEDRMGRENSRTIRHVWSPMAAGRLRNVLPKRRISTFLYNTLMSAYMRAERPRDAMSLLGCMRRRNIRPDETTFHMLMNCSMQYSPYGNQECRQLLRLMQQIGVEPDTIHYNIIIQGYAASNQLTSALQIANRMKEAGVRWDSWTFLFLIKAVIAAGQVELSLRLLSKMRRDGVQPTARHYTLALLGLADAGFYEDAGRVFRRLVGLEAGASQYAYNTMIAINCRRRDMSAALEVQALMEEKGFESNAMTYRFLLGGLIQSQSWELAVGLQAPTMALRGRLEALVRDPQAAPAERLAARVALEDPAEVRNWTRVYHLLIEALVWCGRRNQAVLLLEEMIERGLPVNPWKHGMLFKDTRPSVQENAAVKKALSSRTLRVNDEAELQRKVMQARWLRQAPNWQMDAADERLTGTCTGLAGGPQTRGDAITVEARSKTTREPISVPADLPKLAVPPHVFCASLDPAWVTEPEEKQLPQRSLMDIFSGCLQGRAASSSDVYRVVHDYHHATAQRRALASLQLPAGRSAIVRTMPETLESLRLLFEACGKPGDVGGPAFVFTRPSAAGFDALLALLAASAAHPRDVLLLRPEPNASVKALMAECKERCDQPLSFPLASTLRGIAPAVVVNWQLLIANATKLETSTPSEFEETLQPAVALAPSSTEANGAASDWDTWLREQGLRQLVRCDGGTVRLDGIGFRPSCCAVQLLRVRAAKNNQVSVDLWAGEEEALPASREPALSSS